MFVAMGFFVFFLWLQICRNRFPCIFQKRLRFSDFKEIITFKMVKWYKESVEIAWRPITVTWDYPTRTYSSSTPRPTRVASAKCLNWIMYSISVSMLKDKRQLLNELCLMLAWPSQDFFIRFGLFRRYDSY